MLKYLKQWKSSIPDLPEIDFDKTSTNSFSEIKNIKPSILEKLFSKPELDDLLKILFPKNKTLYLLHKYFQKQSGEKYQKLTKVCSQAITRLKYT